MILLFFIILIFHLLQNDISEVLDLTFSMDADEEKLILYEKAEVNAILFSYVLPLSFMLSLYSIGIL